MNFQNRNVNSTSSKPNDARAQPINCNPSTDSLRAMANRAIIQEINDQLQLKSQKMRMINKVNIGTGGLEQDRSYTGDARPVPASPSIPKPIKSSSKIPSISVKQRRKATKAHTPRANAIENYRPGYTWNRGGRLKELRIRCIARKFLNIWKSAAFGRVLPSTARRHYNVRLMRRGFAELHDHWWVLRKEWGLGIRAELHNRYRLWCIVWKHWRQFTVEARAKTAKKKLADKHANECLQRRVIAGWLVYVQIRRTKKALYVKAQEIYEENLVRNGLQKWIREYQLIGERQQQEQVALQHWSEHLCAKAWVVWRGRFLQRQYLQDRALHAAVHHNRTVVRRGFTAWTQYVQRRREKNADKVRAAQFYCRRKQQLTFDLWRERLLVIYQVRQHQDAIDNLAARVVCRKMVCHWRRYVQMRRDDRDREIIAICHHECQLKRMTVSTWKLFIVQKRIKKMQERMALEFYYKSLLRLGWDSWMQRCEEKEDLQMIPQSRAAYKHYRLVSLQKAWNGLLDYTKWRQERKAQYDDADLHYVAQTLPRCFLQWREFTALSRRKRELMEDALDFRRENLLAKTFYGWHTAYERSQDRRLMERMAILHRADTLVRGTLSAWRHATQDRVEEGLRMTVASEHHESVICRRALRRWRGVVDDKHDMILNTHRAVRHWYCSLMGKVLRKWSQYNAIRQHKHRLTRLATAHYHTRLVRLTLTRWQHHHTAWGQIMVTVEVRERGKQAELMRRVLTQWRHNVDEQRYDKQQEMLAVNHHNVGVLLKVVSSWRQWSVLRVHKRGQTSELVSRARGVLDHNKLRSVFYRWRELRLEAAMTRGKQQRGADHHNVIVVYRAWRGWKEYVHIRMRKQLLARQGMWFHNTRITAKAFSRWKSAYSEAQETHRQTNMALWTWSLQLQRKTLSAWHGYCEERGRKRGRYDDALEQYRSTLLREGATRWLGVAGDLADIRVKYAAERGAKNYYQVHRVVLRCASHWRLWAARRRAEREAQPITAQRERQDQPITAQVGRDQPIRGQDGLEAEPRDRPMRVQQPIIPVMQQQRLPLSTGPSMAAAHAIPQTAGPRVPASVVPPQMCGSPARLPGVSAVSKAPRRAPRKPSFLIDSLKREGLYHSSENSPIEALPDAITTERQTHRTQEPISEEPHIPQNKAALPFQAYSGTIETSSTVSDHHNVIKDASSVHVSDLSAVDFLSTGQTVGDSTARSRTSVVSFQLDRPREEFEFEPRVGPPRSLEHSKDTLVVFERSDDLNVSVSVASEADVQLLPPDAFLFKKDGTPIISDSHQVPTSHKLDGGGDAESTIHQEQTFPNPAEELVAIRKQLKRFHQWKRELKSCQSIHKQLSRWVADQRALSSDDPDMKQTQQEITTLTSEIKTLMTNIEREKPTIQRLTVRVQQLLTSVNPS